MDNKNAMLFLLMLQISTVLAYLVFFDPDKRRKSPSSLVSSYLKYKDWNGAFNNQVQRLFDEPYDDALR